MLYQALTDLWAKRGDDAAPKARIVHSETEWATLWERRLFITKAAERIVEVGGTLRDIATTSAVGPGLQQAKQNVVRMI
jgi:hypothetical protein